jgi:hypothetical protein
MSFEVKENQIEKYDPVQVTQPSLTFPRHTPWMASRQNLRMSFCEMMNIKNLFYTP